MKVADPTGKQVDARLVFSDANKNLVVRVTERDFVTVPQDQVDKFSYEYTKKHRITQGAIVMLTKSKSHWLYVDFHDQNGAKSVVLRMDENQYKQIQDVVKNANRKRRANVAGRKGQEEGGESRGQVSRKTGRFVQDRRCHETIASAYHSREGKKGRPGVPSFFVDYENPQ